LCWKGPEYLKDSEIEYLSSNSNSDFITIAASLHFCVVPCL
jgi:hypothetical protein